MKKKSGPLGFKNVGCSTALVVETWLNCFGHISILQKNCLSNRLYLKLGLKSETSAEVPSSCIISNDQQGQLRWFLKKKNKSVSKDLTSYTVYHLSRHFPNGFMVSVTSSTFSSVQHKITYRIVWFRLEQIHEGAGRALGCSYLLMAKLPSKLALGFWVRTSQERSIAIRNLCRASILSRYYNICLQIDKITTDIMPNSRL